MSHPMSDFDGNSVIKVDAFAGAEHTEVARRHTPATSIVGKDFLCDADVKAGDVQGLNGLVTNISTSAALIVIDVQKGFDDPYWGPTTNPECESNIAKLVSAWESTSRPIVVVRHDSGNVDSPLHPNNPGNESKSVVAEVKPDFLVTKSVNSAFIGTPDLHTWLSQRGIKEIVLCGIQTNMCVETTARMGGNLGYNVIVPLDATRTFDLTGPSVDGVPLTAPASELMRTTAINLQGGGFAQVTTTDALLQTVNRQTP